MSTRNCFVAVHVTSDGFLEEEEEEEGGGEGEGGEGCCFLVCFLFAFLRCLFESPCCDLIVYQINDNIKIENIV